MSVFDGFQNLHPMFVHAPLVLIPTATGLFWIGRRVRGEGFDLATRLITLAGFACAVVASVSGLLAKYGLPEDPSLTAPILQHQINGVGLTIITGLAVAITMLEWAGELPPKAWWLRGVLLTWATVGVFFSGHNGAALVYRYGVAVNRAALKATPAPPPTGRGAP